jgi:flagellar biosynthesis protein
VPAEFDNGQPPQRHQAAIAIKGAIKGAGAKTAGAPSPDAAPRIVAKGHGPAAEQILLLAAATGVTVREDANLAEILEAIEIDTEVPLHALAAVAEILNYVYRANDALAGRTSNKPIAETMT